MAIDEMEKTLRPPYIPLTPYPSKVITLASGERLVVREARREDVGPLLGTLYPLLGVSADFYDIVAARMYAEILGWYRYRVANEFVLVGTIDGVIAGIVTSRHVTSTLGMSLHTLAVKRGLRIGAQLFAAKMEHHIDILGETEVYIVAESPNGFKRWMIEYQLEDRTALFPEVRHELGGVPTYVLTKSLWRAVRDAKCTGSRPVLDAELELAKTLQMPTVYPQIPGFMR
jgi:N-acetylglutamate synthase-like GNAT family acetyltransferase